MESDDRREPLLDGTDPVGATPLSPDDLDGLIPSWVRTRNDLNLAEQRNIVAAVRWAYTGPRRPVSSERLLTVAFSDELHRRMFGEVWSWAGTRRQRQTNIGVAPFRILTEMAQAFDDVRYWHAERTYSTTEIAVRLHHRLVSIHPYPNGNGRQTRMLADLYLFLNGTPRLSWGVRSGVRSNEELRTRYLVALRAADAHDLEPLLRFAE